jgi:ABC-type transport system involved in multi-copper enzyme maturation permease subunit
MRLLWPSWVAAFLMAFSIWLVPNDQSAASNNFANMLIVIPFLACPAMLVTMTLSSFGREISSNTFSNLLAQPIPRARIWWTKTLLLAAAVGIVWAVWWFCLLQNHNFRRVPAEGIRSVFVITVLFVFAAYSGGLWTVLLFRQVAAAFWFTLLLPAAMVMMTNYLLQNQTDWINKALMVVFGVYSLAGFLFARWLFLRAQDVHWTGGALALPGWRRKTAAVTKRGAKRRHPWRSLFAKEIQLHQSQLMIAGILALLHGCVLLARKFGGDLRGHLILEILLDGFWILWFVMPLLVGCDAVAEERKLGTLEAQLCLPVRRRTQFIIKFITTLLLSVLLGVVVPVLFEGGRILPAALATHTGTPIGNILFGDFALYLNWTLPFLLLAGIAVLTATISFYASTLARSTVQAIAPAMLGIIITWVSLVAVEGIHAVFPLWRGWLGHVIGVPVMTLVVFGLMYWNFKRVLVGWSVWRRNIFVLIVSLAFVTTAAATLYNRAWELLTPVEPAHGPALPVAQTATLKSDGATVIVQLADGRVWKNHFRIFPTLLASQVSDGGYMQGTNWASVDKCHSDFAGIQRDGSLWVRSATAPQWTRVGNENDWKSVVGSQGAQIFLLKMNNTLWCLGTNGFSSTKRAWPGLAAFAPQRLGMDSDWAEIFSSANRRAVFRKTDGRVWIMPPISMEEETMELQPGLKVQRAPYFDVYKATTELFGPFGIFSVGIRDDGTFRAATEVGFVTGRRDGRVRSPTTKSADIPLSLETNWLAVAGNLDHVVTLRSDGTLWKWTFPQYPKTDPNTAAAVQFSKHSDWVDIALGMDGLVGLAADGSLWFSQFEPGRSQRNQTPSLLRASRRPQFVGNIFVPASP